MTINDGSIETMVIQVVDELGTLPELPSGTVFDIRDTDGEDKIIGTVATVEGMRAYCVIDTTHASLTVGDYDLFLRFGNTPDSPKLGPHRFRIQA